MIKFNLEKLLPVMEHFYTIQGEGNFSGIPAYFIRVAGCDIGCFWCDVKESWEVKESQLVQIEKIIGDINKTKCKFCVITGGEPAMYDLTYLCNELKKNGIKSAIETSGAYPLIGNIDWVCLSPKKFKPPIQSIYPLTNELKIIIYNKSDFEWAEEHAKKVNNNCKLFLQPEWEKQEKMLPLIIDYVKKNPKWAISLQTHKFMNIP